MGRNKLEDKLGRNAYLPYQSAKVRVLSLLPFQLSAKVHLGKQDGNSGTRVADTLVEDSD